MKSSSAEYERKATEMGCTDHYCFVRGFPLKGMGTNGGCNCIKHPKSHEVARWLNLKNARIDELEAFLREAKEKNERDVEREREVAKASYDRLLQNYTEILEKLKQFEQ